MSFSFFHCKNPGQTSWGRQNCCSGHSLSPIFYQYQTFYFICSDQIIQLTLLFVFSLAAFSRSDSVHWDGTERRGWAREGNHTGEANKPPTTSQPPLLHHHGHAPPALLIPPEPAPLSSVASSFNGFNESAARSAWPPPSSGSCLPRSWGSSWWALGSSGEWCCCTSPSSNEPATRTAPCWSSRSWTSASAT